MMQVFKQKGCLRHYIAEKDVKTNYESIKSLINTALGLICDGVADSIFKFIKAERILHPTIPQTGLVWSAVYQSLDRAACPQSKEHYSHSQGRRPTTENPNTNTHNVLLISSRIQRCLMKRL